MPFEVRFGDGRRETKATREEAKSLVRAWLEEPFDEKPNFTHDCTACVFLGTVGGVADLYFCEQRFGPTVIARFSSHGPNYISGLLFAESNGFIMDARTRSRRRGLLPQWVEGELEAYGWGMKLASIRPAGEAAAEIKGSQEE